MEQQTDNCAQCNKPKGSKNSGSITQWVFGANSCRCDAPAPAPRGGIGVAHGAGSSSGSAAVTICPRCRKPEYKSVRERGSITQWVMRANACTCINESSKTLRETVTDSEPVSKDQAESPELEEQLDSPEIYDDENDNEVVETDQVPVKNSERNFGPLAVMLLMIVVVGGGAAMVSSFLDKPAISELSAKKSSESETVDEKWDKAVKFMDTNLMPAFSTIAEADLKRLRSGSDLLPSEPDLLLRGSDVNDGDLAKLSRCKKLGELDLSDTKITDASIPHIVKAKSIRKLLLNGVKLKADSLKLLSVLPLLEELQLDNAGLTDAHLDAISALRKLRVLKVGNNSAITDGGVEVLANLSKLEVLDLTGTKISAGASRLLAEIKGLTINGLPRPAQQP